MKNTYDKRAAFWAVFCAIMVTAFYVTFWGGV